VKEKKSSEGKSERWKKKRKENLAESSQCKSNFRTGQGETEENRGEPSDIHKKRKKTKVRGRNKKKTLAAQRKEL